MQTFDFDVTMYDLVEAEGIDGLNEILDERMAAQGIDGYAADVSYWPINLDVQGDQHMLTIRAKFQLYQGDNE